MAIHSTRSIGRRFGSAHEASSAVEFALLFPILLVLMLVGTQVVAYINAVRKVELLAASISEMISQATPPSNATTIATVNMQDLHFSFDSALVIFPYLMKDAAGQGIQWWQDIMIDYASIQFTQIASTCPTTGDQSACYVANVVWTSTGTAGSNYRPCIIPQLPASNTASPSRATLPTSIFGAGSLIAIDIVFKFRPVFASTFMQPINISRSVFVQPRYASLINYDTTNNDGIATKCPGY